MIPLFPTQLLAENVNWVKGDGSPVAAFYYLVRALFNRTGQNNGIPFTVGSGLMAQGSFQSSALPLTNDLNDVTGGSGGVVLDNLHPGQLQLVYCGIASGLNVYPAPFGQIDALGVNNPYSLANGKSQIFWCPSLLPNSSGSQYRSLQLG